MEASDIVMPNQPSPTWSWKRLLHLLARIPLSLLKPLDFFRAITATIRRIRSIDGDSSSAEPSMSKSSDFPSPPRVHRKRCYSWPPIRLRQFRHQYQQKQQQQQQQHSKSQDDDKWHDRLVPKDVMTAMDDDPFAFFISPSSPTEELEDYIGDWQHANIGDVPRPRSASPFHLPMRNRDSGPPILQGSSPPMSKGSPTTVAIKMLKKWVRRMEGQYFAKQQKDKDAASKPLVFPLSPELRPQVPVPSGSSPHLRGRRALRRTRSIGNREVRSHSGRPRIWRAPDSDIWTLQEEVYETNSKDQEELEEVGLGILL